MKQLLLISMITFITSLCMADKESRIREGYVSFPDGVTEESEMKRLGIEKHKIGQHTYVNPGNQYVPPYAMSATEFTCRREWWNLLHLLPKAVKCERCGTKGSYRLGYIYCVDKKQHYCEICIKGLLAMSAWQNEYLRCEDFLAGFENIYHPLPNEAAEFNEKIQTVKRRYQQECYDAFRAAENWFKSDKLWW